MRLTHGSTFSGIGAPEVAAAMLGWENVFHCEINPFGRQVLDYYFPNAKSYEDITKTDFSEWRGKIDVLTGGFPCQPFSYAGKRGGAEDDRYLWPYMLRCIEQVRPTWFVGENVGGITTMVLPGTETQMGSHSTLFGEGDTYTRTRQRYVIEEICSNLEAIGYTVQPMLIPACAVGAPHRRDRIFILAHNERDAQDSLHFRFKEGDEELGYTKQHGNTIAAGRNGEIGLDASNTDRSRCSSPEWRGRPERTEMDGERKNESLFGFGRPCTPSTPPDTYNNGLQHSVERGCEGEETSTQSGRGEDCLSFGTQPVEADGKRWSSSSTDREGIGIHGEKRNATDTESKRRNERQYVNGVIEGAQQTECREQQPCGADCTLGEGERGCYGLPWCGLVADTDRNRGREVHQPLQPQLADGTEPISNGRKSDISASKAQSRHGYDADTNCEGLEGDASLRVQGHERRGQSDGFRECSRSGGEIDYLYPSERWRTFPTVSPVYRGNDGFPFSLDNLTIPFNKWRTESLKAYGNAIVPQVMYEIFSAIEATYD